MEQSASGPQDALWGYENPKAQTSIEDFEVLIQEAYKLKKSAKDLEDQAEEVKAILKEKQAKIQAIMEDLGKEIYKSDSGTVSLKTSLSVATPKDPKSKQDFFAWLSDQGLFDEYASVDSRKLNTLYNSLSEKSETPITIPGIGPATPFKTLKLLK